MLDIEGTELDAQDRDVLLDPQVGGVIFFARNFVSRAQITALSTEIRALRPTLLLAVDQEGGRVQRFKEGFTRLPPMQCFHQLHCDDTAAALALARDSGWLMAAELIDSGLDFSFAPVLDADADRCGAIADRAFSADVERVTALAGAFIEGMHEAGMAATGKHFPGHGGVVADSHLELPVDGRSWEALATADLVPFARLADRLDAVMPAHILFSEIDSRPVGFSPIWLQQRLRGELGFTGVIFSDDLSMEGAGAAGGYAERAEAALRAGCDMVLACNNRRGALEVLQHLHNLDWPIPARVATMRTEGRNGLALAAAPARWERTAAALAVLG
ncbi:beta-N-acetylhexosaminidase [Exilibacterium tricleocarpae]|uniref:Beta-hexosaminidase n=2 Tax=Exilibacterium tricleocarpae TaxID=2591008 RepID=A0A545TVY7_9GAMM|nr:beta-N-acetylhexosaminidase [Exilibacterium tricleocarpae]